jgi:phosphatidylglycerol:prolipoprotein diacylglycerol transferase
MVAGLIVIAAILKRRLDRKLWRGEVVALYALCYGLLRFFAEFVRGDSARSVLGMTVSQTISLGLILVAMGAFMWAWRTGRLQRPPVDKSL